MPPITKRLGLLAVAALALGACEFGLGSPPDTLTQPGAEVTLTNEGETLDQCPVPVKDPGPQAVGEPDPEGGVPVFAVLLEKLMELDDPELVVESFTDDQGRFSETITAPEIPGAYFIILGCNPEAQPGPMLSPADVNEDGFYFDFLEVAHTPITIALSDDEVEDGETVQATFTPCQAANDLGLSDPESSPELPEGGELEAMAEPTQEEIFTDYPDLEVFLDGKLVKTVAGTERHPTEPIVVDVVVEGEGEHEISGVCTHQTFDIDEVLIEEELVGQLPSAAGVGAAAVEYPFSPEGQPFTYDEATSTAAAPVTVAAVDAAETPRPVEAQPSYTG